MTTTVSLNPFAPEATQNPYAVHAALRRVGLVHVPEIDTWVASRYEDLEAILRDQENFTARNAAGGGGRLQDPELAAAYTDAYPMARTLMTADPPEHRWYRSVLSQKFTPKSAADMEGFVGEVVNGLIDDLPTDRHADVVECLALPTPLIVFCHLAAIPDDELPLITRFTNDLNDSFTFEVANLGRPRELEIIASVITFQNYVLDKIRQRREAPGDDLISMMLGTVVPGLGDRTLTDLEMLSSVALLLNAGTETTMNLLGNAIELFIRHPAQWEAIREDRSLLRNAVDEVLRLESPVQALFRNAKNDVEINGVVIPARGRVALLYGAANRDPERWTDPETFDITRPDASKGLYFGSGEHFCLGAHLARLEGRVAMNAMLDRLPGLRLTEDNDFARRLNPLTRGFAHLNVEWDGTS
jgi:cytochrome P450